MARFIWKRCHILHFGLYFLVLGLQLTNLSGLKSKVVAMKTGDSHNLNLNSTLKFPPRSTEVPSRPRLAIRCLINQKSTNDLVEVKNDEPLVFNQSFLTMMVFCGAPYPIEWKTSSQTVQKHAVFKLIPYQTEFNKSLGFQFDALINFANRITINSGSVLSGAAAGGEGKALRFFNAENFSYFLMIAMSPAYGQFGYMGSCQAIQQQQSSSSATAASVQVFSPAPKENLAGNYFIGAGRRFKILNRRKISIKSATGNKSESGSGFLIPCPSMSMEQSTTLNISLIQISKDEILTIRESRYDPKVGFYLWGNETLEGTFQCQFQLEKNQSVTFEFIQNRGQYVNTDEEEWLEITDKSETLDFERLSNATTAIAYFDEMGVPICGNKENPEPVEFIRIGCQTSVECKLFNSCSSKFCRPIVTEAEPCFKETGNCALFRSLVAPALYKCNFDGKKDFGYSFTGVDGKIYYRSADGQQHIPRAALIQIKIRAVGTSNNEENLNLNQNQNGSTLYTNQLYSFLCAPSKFFFNQKLVLLVQYESGQRAYFPGAKFVRYNEFFGSSKLEVEIQVTVTVNMTGVWCLAPWSNSSEWMEEMKPFTVKDVSAPKIEQVGNDAGKTFYIGDKGRGLICSATGEPKSTLKWTTENGKEIGTESGISTKSCVGETVLRFTEITQNHQGVYACTATNGVGTDQHKFYVRVKPKEKIRTPTPILERMFYVGDAKTNLSCSAGQEPNSTFEWTKNSKNGVESVIFPTILLGNKSILQFPTMAKDVGGTYVCEVGDELKSTVHTFEVTVRDPKPPEIKTEQGGDKQERVFYIGEDKRNLICAATGDPTPNFKWTKNSENGTELGANVGFSVQRSANSAILSFPTITEDHQGDYFCVASNRFATVHRKFPVNVRSQSQKDSSLSAEEIVGVVIGILIFVLAFLFVLFKYWQTRRQLRNLTADEIDEFVKGNPDKVGKSEDGEGHENIHFLPFNKQFEVPHSEFSIDEKVNLGAGEFGVVCGGKLRGVDVAIKTTKSTVNVEFFLAFLKEIKVMTFIGKHPNVVQLLGTSTIRIRERVVFVILELGIHGDLNSFLTEHQENFMSVISSSQVLENQSEQASLAESETEAEMGSGYSSVPMETMAMQLIKWCGQIAAGMSHLSSKKIIHGDLAARNILLFDGYTAKISDFGFSRRLYTNIYAKTGPTQLPWRIMAPESLKHLQFSLKSDVWAFGVLIWEIFSLGAVPFSGYEYSLEFIEELEEGLRLPRPNWASEEIYENMKECWAAGAKNRPGFDQLERFYTAVLDSISGTRTRSGTVYKVESE